MTGSANFNCPSCCRSALEATYGKPTFQCGVCGETVRVSGGSREPGHALVPEQLRGYELIRVEREEKAPAVGPEHTEPLSAIRRWVTDGGNYGVRAAVGDDLVIIDVDHADLRAAIQSCLPATFTVETGGGEHRYYRCASWGENHQLTDDGTDLGSLRARNWYAVGPGSVHPGGERYRVFRDRPLACVGSNTLAELVERFGSRDPPAAGAARVGGSGDIPSVPSRYPARDSAFQRG